jgi:hypothetical protein
MKRIRFSGHFCPRYTPACLIQLKPRVFFPLSAHIAPSFAFPEPGPKVRNSPKLPLLLRSGDSGTQTVAHSPRTGGAQRRAGRHAAADRLTGISTKESRVDGGWKIIQEWL